MFVVVTHLRSEGNAGNIQDYPYGVLSIIKHNKGLADFDIIDVAVNNDNLPQLEERLRQKLQSFQPEILGISVMFDNAYFAIAPIIQLTKDVLPTCLVVCGGPAVSPIAKKILQNQPGLDAVCFSEGELPFQDLLMADDLFKAVDDHPSWVSRKDMDSAKGPQKKLLNDLDQVIDIDYSLIDVFDYERRVSFNPLDDRYLDNLRAFPIVTSRGCPFKCSFCWHSGENDKSMRYAGVDELIAHVEKIIALYGANCLIFYDDMLLLARDRAKEIFRRLAPYNLRIELPNGLSPTYMDEELVELMYKAGVRSVRIAVESGDEWVIRNLVNKPMKIAHVQPVVDALRKYDIWVVAFIVVGLPGETDAHRKTTREKIIEWGIDLCSISVASPIKGSLLYEQCLKEGYIDPNAEFQVSGFLFGENVINTKEFTAEYISDAAYLMNLDVNFVNAYRLQKGDYAAAASYFQYITRTYQNHAFGHYCLALAKAHLGERALAEKHWLEARRIGESDPLWGGYFRHFDIAFDDRFEDFLSGISIQTLHSTLADLRLAPEQGVLAGHVA
ncbi:hypothetical protein BTR14_16400 [Rhizobium rhizosphaerae]|uniref:Uncharacterized protein n=1 Tax=Xaviernesmea rhizosphaerae TaxID=1672749 RepID=A0ABX3P9W8_9HYPH|nr:hypothetical protein BTR14_16400 [Xaviernesmea rhizosphaerae]